MSAMRVQTEVSKLGEIKYRSLIVKQQTSNEKIFKNEPTQREFKKLINPKLKQTEKTLKQLQKKGVVLSPYLEIGSEHCLRPMILENKFKAKGFATDISFYSLANAKKFAKIFKFKKVPTLICADAYNLPFKSNSFPFIFIYESLHHFPDPKPPLKEIQRILSGSGYLLIGADPIKQSFQIPFWQRPNKLRYWEKILKTFLILPFISKIGKTESKYDIIEGAFDLKTWQKSLDIFDSVEVRIETYPFGQSELLIKSKKQNWLIPNLKIKIPLFFFGGGIQALCFKNGKKAKINKDLKNILICPNCKKIKDKEIKLNANFCTSCQTHYPTRKNVYMLLEKSLLEKVQNQKLK